RRGAALPGPLLPTGPAVVLEHRAAQLALAVDDPALVALAVATVLRVLQLESAPPVGREPLLAHQDVDVIPRQPLVDGALAQRVGHVEARLLDGPHPQVEAEVLPPGVEATAEPEGRLEQVARAAIAP